MITDMGGKDLFSIKKSRGKIFKYVKDKKYLIFSYALLLRKKKLQMVQNKTTSFTNIKFSASYLILKLRGRNKSVSGHGWSKHHHSRNFCI
jgi:protein tyrosine phosphatase